MSPGDAPDDTTRHVGVAACGVGPGRIRVVAVLAVGSRWRTLLDLEVDGEAGTSAHAAVVHALVDLARLRGDGASPLDVFVCQQSVVQAGSWQGFGAELLRSGLDLRWWPKTFAAAVPALARALALGPHLTRAAAPAAPSERPAATDAPAAAPSARTGPLRASTGAP